jgi:hypothetical protein
MRVRPEFVTGHDFRVYSFSTKHALICGMMAAGLKVKDIGFVLTPMAYFPQFALGCPCVAMLTASHNESGWTGVKIGAEHPVTFSPHEMDWLSETVLDSRFAMRGCGTLQLVPDLRETSLEEQRVAGFRNFSGAHPLARVGGLVKPHTKGWVQICARHGHSQNDQGRPSPAK